MTDEKPPARRIGIGALEKRLGTERTTIWRWYNAGKLPKPHYIGKRRAWWLHEIEAWEAAQKDRPAPARVSPTAIRPAAPRSHHPLFRIAAALERMATALESVLEKQSPKGKK